LSSKNIQSSENGKKIKTTGNCSYLTKEGLAKKSIFELIRDEQIKKTETLNRAKELLHYGMITADSQSTRSYSSIVADQKTLSEQNGQCHAGNNFGSRGPVGIVFQRISMYFNIFLSYFNDVFLQSLNCKLIDNNFYILILQNLTSII